MRYALLALLLVLRLRAVGVVVGPGDTDAWIRRLTASGTALREGLDNTPTPAALASLTTVVVPRLALLWRLFPDLSITSGYRSEAVNQAVGGSKGSLHTQGRAVDVSIAPGRKATWEEAQIAFEALQAAGLPSRVAWYERKVHLHVDNAGVGIFVDRGDGKGWRRIA